MLARALFLQEVASRGPVQLSYEEVHRVLQGFLPEASQESRAVSWVDIGIGHRMRDYSVTPTKNCIYDPCLLGVPEIFTVVHRGTGSVGVLYVGIHGLFM